MHKAKDSPPHWEETAVFSLARPGGASETKTMVKATPTPCWCETEDQRKEGEQRRRTKENLEGGKEELEVRGSEGKRR